MEILTYKLLNEQPLNQANLKSLVNINRERGASITKVSAANAYRNLIFSFVNRLVYDRHVNRNVGYPRRLTLTTVNYNFLTIYEGNTCYFYPYVNQDVVKLNQDEVRTYLKIELFDRTDPTKPVNIKNYFSTFQRDPSRLNKNNVFVFRIKIGPKFDEINQKYSIKNQAILKLPAIARRPNTYYVSFDSISSEFKVDDRYNRKDTNAIAPQIIFSSNQQGSINIINNFNRWFNGINIFNIRKLVRASSLTTIPQTFRYVTEFTSQGRKFIIYTENEIDNYFEQNQFNQNKNCYLYSNSGFIQAQLKVINVN